MSEQFQPQSHERSTTHLEHGDYLSLHESELSSYEQGRALAQATQAAESSAQQRLEQAPLPPAEQIAVISKYVIHLRHQELGQSDEAA